MLSLDFCKKRVERLQKHLEKAKLDSAVITSARMVYYFSGSLVDANWPQAMVVRGGGETMLVTNKQPSRCAADEVRVYTGYTVAQPFSRFTMQQELNREVVSHVVAPRVGAEFESMPASLVAALAVTLEDLTPWLMEARRPKDADEIESMRATVELTERGNRAIRDKIAAGMTEIDAYCLIQEAIHKAAGTSVELKGDFACGTRALQEGGPPTRRRLEPGDLYILDLFPDFEGYKCDLCRTFSVGRPSPEQLEVWAHVRNAHEIAMRLIRPGASPRQAHLELLDYLDRYPSTRGSYQHHSGHGVGMEGWEQPWLNGGSDQVFIEGEVIACEPGLYGEHLRGGIRLEHNYLVTADGPLALDTFPFDLY